MDVRLPNGVIIQNVPEGTSKEEIRQKAIAKGIAKESDFPQVAQVAPPQSEELSPLGALEAAGTMVSGILAEPVAGLAGIASIPLKGSEAGEIVNKVRDLLTYQPQTEEGKQALQAVAGALEPLGNAIQSAEEYLGDKGYELAGPAGGAAGATLPTAIGELLGAAGINVAAKGAGRAKNAVTGTIPEADAALIEAARDVNVPIHTSDIRPPSTFPGKIIQQTGEKIPVAGTAGMRETQQSLRVKAVEDYVSKYGEFGYSNIVDSLKTKRDTVKRAAGNVLSRVGESLDAVGEVSMPGTAEAIAKARQELNKPNVISSSNASEDLTALMDALEQPQTFTSLKENRTAFREIVKSTDKAERSQLTSRAKSLLDNVYSAMGKDMESFAKTNLTDREFNSWQRANAAYANEATKLTRSKLKNILDKGDVTPESVNQMLFSQNPSEQRLLYNSLTNEGRKHARSAIISKIVTDLNRRASGMTPNSFASELGKYKSQVDTFFKGDEKRQLVGLQRVLDATRRAQDAAITTPTGQQLLGAVGVTGIAIDPITTLGSGVLVGRSTRLLETPVVRNALLKLGSAQPGSDKYAEALLAAHFAWQSASQKAPEQSSDTEQPQSSRR